MLNKRRFCQNRKSNNTLAPTTTKKLPGLAPEATKPSPLKRYRFVIVELHVHEISPNARVPLLRESIPPVGSPIVRDRRYELPTAIVLFIHIYANVNASIGTILRYAS